MSERLRKTTRLGRVKLSKLPRLTAVAALSAALTLSGPVMALPTNGTVTGGQASISLPGPKQLKINQTSSRAAIDWKNFDIDTDEVVTISQPSSAASILNRVIGGGGSSQLLGALIANGQVVLINPRGVDIGPLARIDVGSLIATTIDIPTANYLAGGLSFTQPGDPNAIIVNEGTITAAEGGLVALVAPAVVNSGVITARLGKVALAAGNKFTLDLYGDDLVHIAVDGAVLQAVTGADGATLDALVSHTGRIEADGGYVQISAQAAAGVVDTLINMTGQVRARTVADAGGTVVLEGRGSGAVLASGQIDASGRDAGERGGEVRILGPRVALSGSATIDASGDAGGGVVFLGGDYQGGGDTQTAERTFVGADATIAADALSDGDGGRVIVWADQSTWFYGAITARGGAQSGDGGFVEVSGKQNLAFNGTVDPTAPNGANGSLLLDPDFIVIVDDTTGANDAEIADGVVNAADGAGTFTISETALEGLPAGTDIFLEATSGITLNNLTDGLLTLDQTGTVIFNITGTGNFATIDTTDQIILSGGADLTIAALDGAVTVGGVNTAGNITLTGAGGAVSSGTLNVTGDVTINALGGGVTLGAVAMGGLLDVSAAGTIIVNGAIFANGGINLATDLAAPGNINLNATLTSAAGAIVLDTTNAFSSGPGDIFSDGSGLTAATGIDIDVDDIVFADSMTVTGSGDINVAASSDPDFTGTIDLNGGSLTTTDGAVVLSAPIGGVDPGDVAASGAVTIIAQSVALNDDVSAGGTATITATGAVTLSPIGVGLDSSGTLSVTAGSFNAGAGAVVGSDNGAFVFNLTGNFILGDSGEFFAEDDSTIVAANVSANASSDFDISIGGLTIDTSVGGGSISLGQVDANGAILLRTDDAVSLGDDLDSSTSITIEAADGQDMLLGAAGEGGFDLTDAELNFIGAPTLTLLTGGTVFLAGTTAADTDGIDSLILNGATAVNVTSSSVVQNDITLTTAGSINFSSSLSTTLGDLTANAGGTITVPGEGLVSSAGTLTFSGTGGVSIGNSATVQSAANFAITSTGGNLTLSNFADLTGGAASTITAIDLVSGTSSGISVGANSLTIRSATASPINVADGGAGLTLDTTELAGLFTLGTLILGSTADNAAIEVGDLTGTTLADGGINTLSLNSNTTVSLANAGSAYNVNSLAVTANGGINVATSISATGSLTFNSAATLATGATFSTTGGNATFATVDGAQSLAVNAGGGAVTLGDVGGTTALASLAVTGGTIALNDVTTTGAQSYTGTTTFSSAYATGGADFTVNGDATLNDNTSVDTGGGDIDFLGAVAGAGAGGQNLTLTADAGDILFNGAVGSVEAPLGDLTIVSVNDVTVNDTIQTAQFVQASGTGLTDLGLSSLHTSGDIFISTTDIEGAIFGADATLIATGAIGAAAPLFVNVASLTLGATSVNLTGTINGLSGADALAFITFLGGVVPSPFTFGGIDLLPFLDGSGTLGGGSDGIIIVVVNNQVIEQTGEGTDDGGDGGEVVDLTVATLDVDDPLLEVVMLTQGGDLSDDEEDEGTGAGGCTCSAQ